jgi:hypothetical protein
MPFLFVCVLLTSFFSEATNAFTKVCCAVLGFSEESPLHVALNAGCASMPTHLKFASLLKAKSARKPNHSLCLSLLRSTRSLPHSITPLLASSHSLLLVSSSAGSDAPPSLLGQKEFQAEVDLGKQYQFHSVFTCPVSREQSTKVKETTIMLPISCSHF